MNITSTISSVFGRSPISAIENHIQVVHQAAETLVPFFHAVLADDWAEAAKQQQSIAKQEREADDLKRDLRLNLPNSLFLPVSRTDLLTLLSVQDKIANRAKDIAGIIIGRNLKIPADVADTFMDFLECSLDASRQAQKAINELDELLSTGFSGEDVKLVENMIIELDKIEQDSDAKQVILRKKIFVKESELPAVDIMFLYKVIDWIGDLADRAQTVGAHLQVLMAR